MVLPQDDPALRLLTESNGNAKYLTPAQADAKYLTTVNLDTARKQAWLYGDFMRKLRTGTAVTICAMGDSTTYGYDVISADRVAASTEITPNGGAHTYTRSPVPYPAAMQTNLEEVFGAGKVTVINRGFSGDTATSAFNRWITTSGAGLTIISLGINDANNGATVQTYIESYEKLILREINDYGSAVVILTPFKQPNPSPSRTMDAFRAAVLPLANKYGVPVIDAEPWLAGYSNDVFSDSTHMNTKGNGILGARAASLFIGEGPLSPNVVSSGTRLSIRPTIDNITYGPGAAISSGGVAGSLPENSNSTAGIYASLGASDTARSVYYSFYAATTDLVIGLDYTLQPNTTITATLDFGVEQPDNILDELVGESLSWTARAASSFAHAATGTSFSTFTGLPASTRRIRVASPGWHTLRVTGTGGATTSPIRVYAAEFMNYRAYKNAQKGGALHLPQPGEVFNESTDITETRVKMADVLNRLDIPDWGTGTFKAAPLKVTIRTYGQRVLEYLLVVNSTPTANAGTPVEKWAQLRSTALITTPDETQVREIGSVTFDATNKEIVFTWLATSKNLKKNFVMDISVL